MEIIALAIVVVGLAAVYAWWDVKRGDRDDVQAQLRVSELEKDVRGIWERLRPLETHDKDHGARINSVAITVASCQTDIAKLDEQLLDTRNSVAGLKGLQPKVRKYG